jgi:radical SAM enzyme (TIGR01210 family)
MSLVNKMSEQRRERGRHEPVALWKEDDVLEGKKVRAMVVILRTRGCWWSKAGGCTICGYNAESDAHLTEQDVLAQIETAKGRYTGEEMVKVYTSGSFLDANEISPAAREAVSGSFAPAKRLLIESRPEFCDAAGVEWMSSHRAQVAIGLESANPEILRRSVRKGFSPTDYENAAIRLRDGGVPLRTYLLLKPPYLTERAAMFDTIASAAFAAPYSESVSINPVNVQAGTFLEDLWRRGDYRPPWMWTLLEVLKASVRPGVRVFSSPSGAGTRRGVHNCDNCDAKAIDALKAFSLSQDISDLEIPICSCRKEWQAAVDLQDGMLSSADMRRHLDSIMEID